MKDGLLVDRVRHGSEANYEPEYMEPARVERLVADGEWLIVQTGLREYTASLLDSRKQMHRPSSSS
jgi:hypothetical protein